MKDNLTIFIPINSFYLSCSFAIIGYIFEINLGNDDYQTWNIGFNPSDLDYLKGRMNGFQAGGPNSFADLITITAVYSLFKYKNSYAFFIVPLALYCSNSYLLKIFINCFNTIYFYKVHKRKIVYSTNCLSIGIVNCCNSIRSLREIYK